MRLQAQGIMQTGDALLDGGITDLKAVVIDGVVHLYSSTGRNGGLTHYTLDAQGHASVTTSVIFPPSITGTVGDRLVLNPDMGPPMLLVGSAAGGLYGYVLDAGGGMASLTTLNWQQLETAVAAGSITTAEAMITLSDTAPGGFPLAFDCTQIVDLARVSVNGVEIVLAACGAMQGVTSFVAQGSTMVEADTKGAAQGVGVSAPTAMEVVQIGGQTFVILAASGTSSLTVMRVDADGSLMPTDHVLDNATTRFEGVQDLAVATSGDHVFVVAGGADNGLTLFLMLPDGSLLHLQTLGDTAATSLHRVTALSAVVEGDTLMVFAGSQNESGVTRFDLDLTNLGAMQTGTAAAELLLGGAGDDILVAAGDNDSLSGGWGDDVLVAGAGRTRMTGGTGADIFVLREESRTVTITDFQRGQDRIDLGDLPMLRDLSQLTVIPTATGARIEFRGYVVHVTSATGQPLSRNDLFPEGLAGGDHIGWIPPDEGWDGYYLFGNDGADSLAGSDGNDTLEGAGGADTLSGGLGEDVIDGGWGGDLIQGGPGGDTLLGGIGNDLIFGGTGSDSIDGGSQDDTLHGEQGNDWIFGAQGHDWLHGGTGSDTMLGGGGNDVLFGDEDNDRLYGQWGRDTIRGGDGDDAVWGEWGNDVIYGDAGNDWLSGGDGDDYLNGGDGNDTLRGGTGIDYLVGGAGADVFEFFGDHDTARIRDFNPAEGDRLRLDDAMWAALGPMTPQELYDRFGGVNQWGNLILDLSEVGGCVVIFWRFHDADALVGAIDYM